MTIYDVASRISGTGEYILGADATGSHACYLVYGALAPAEKGRELRPGRGHEEMVLCIRGEMRLSGACSGVLREGQAVHLTGEESCLVENLLPRETVYVIAGGHSSGHHH